MGPIQWMVDNKKKVVQNAAAQKGFDIQDVELLQSCKSIRIVLTERLDKDVRERLKENFPKLRFTGIDYEMDDLHGPGLKIFEFITFGI